jgi:hypothetical protein
MLNAAPRGALRDLGEALRLINGVRTGYDLAPAELQSLLDVAIALRKARDAIIERHCIEKAGPDCDVPLITEQEFAEIQAKRDMLDRDEHGQPRIGR